MFGKRNGKYNAKKVVIDGILFDSTKEGQRYRYLKEQELQGVIKDLRLQVKFELLPRQTCKVIKHLKTKDVEVDKFLYHPVIYTCDFAYIISETNSYVVEDVKASKKQAALDKSFPLREKMLYFFHGIRLHKVYKATEPIYND